MNLMMIAVIWRGNKKIGLRIFDVDNKTFMDIPIDNIKQVLMSGKAEIGNLGIVNGELVSINGIFERYPKLTENKKLLSKTGKSPLVIINQLEDKGYTVVDYNGVVKLASTADVVRYAKENSISNGKVVVKDNVEFISSIAGSYPVEQINIRKKQETKGEKKYIKKNIEKDTSVVAQGVKSDVEFEIDEKDVFDVFTDTQRLVIKNYYIWYTVDKYKSMAKNIRFNISTSKAEALAKLRGIKDWEFAGVWDTGYVGGGECELGHQLRYVYYAIPSDDRYNKDARLAFGINCSADFFRIDQKDMNALRNTTKMMSDEIKIMSDTIVNSEEQKQMNKTKLLYDVLDKLGSNDKIIDVFGERVGNTLIQFRMVNIPFPMTLVIESSKQIAGEPEIFYRKVFPEYNDVITEVFAWGNKSDIIDGVNEYLRFIACNKIEGDYGYNPLDNDQIKRRDIGGYNKKTRSDRSSFNYRIRTLTTCKDYSMEELDSLLFSMQKLLPLRNKMVDAMKNIIEDLGIDTNMRDMSNYHLLQKVRDFIEVEGLSKDEYIIRANMYNGLVLHKEYRSYNYNQLVYADIKGSGDVEVKRCRNIIYLRNDLENHDIYNGLDNSIAELKEYFERYIEEKDRAEKERLEQEERERLELEEQEKKEREREEEEKRQKEEKKNKGDNEDKLDRLKKLIELHPNVPEDYGIGVAKDILKRNKSYKKLSPRQRWRIDETIRTYERIENSYKENSSLNSKSREIGKSDNDKNKDVDTPDSGIEKENKRYLLKEHEDIKGKINLIIEKADSVEMQEVLKEVPLALKIAYTVNKHGRISDRQLKHINKAVELIENA